MIDVPKSVLIDAVCHIGFKSMDHADEMTKAGLASFCGNQWNEDWAWNRARLGEMSEQELVALYEDIFNAKNKH